MSVFVCNNFEDCNFLCHKEFGRTTSCMAGGFFADIIHSSTSSHKVYALTTTNEAGRLQ